MAEIRIEVRSPSETASDARWDATVSFAEQLRHDTGLEVDVVGIDLPTGQRGFTFIEVTLLFIGNAVATSLLDSLTSDLYDAAKEFLRRRRRTETHDDGSEQDLGFVIYGPDGEVLDRWDTRDDR